MAHSFVQNTHPGYLAVCQAGLGVGNTMRYLGLVTDACTISVQCDNCRRILPREDMEQISQIRV